MKEMTEEEKWARVKELTKEADAIVQTMDGSRTGWLMCAQHSDGRPADGCYIDFYAAAYGNPVLIAAGLDDMISNQKSGSGAGLLNILTVVVSLVGKNKKKTEEAGDE